MKRLISISILIILILSFSLTVFAEEDIETVYNPNNQTESSSSRNSDEDGTSDIISAVLGVIAIFGAVGGVYLGKKISNI